MKNIVLIGMPGCGKTSIGQVLAKLLGMGFIDTDAIIEANQQRTIPEIFAAEGERFFRTLESEAVRLASERTGAVIATGGGAVLCYENIRCLKKTGLLIFIDRPIKHIVADIDIANRPLLSNKAPDKESTLPELYKSRLPIYIKAADISVINDGTIDGIINDIIQKINREELP